MMLTYRELHSLSPRLGVAQRVGANRPLLHFQGHEFPRARSLDVRTHDLNAGQAAMLGHPPMSFVEVEDEAGYKDRCDTGVEGEGVTTRDRERDSTAPKLWSRMTCS